MRILLFARLRDLCGTSSVDLNISTPCSVADIRSALQQAYPEHHALFAAGSALAAINQCMSSSDSDPVSPEDEIAFFPPVTGG